MEDNLLISRIKQLLIE